MGEHMTWETMTTMFTKGHLPQIRAQKKFMHRTVFDIQDKVLYIIGLGFKISKYLESICCVSTLYWSCMRCKMWDFIYSHRTYSLVLIMTNVLEELRAVAS